MTSQAGEMTADGKSVFNTRFLPRNALGSNPLDQAKYLPMTVKSYAGYRQPGFRLQDGKPEYRKTLRDGTTGFWHDVRELIQKKEAFYMDVVVDTDLIPYGNGPNAEVPSLCKLLPQLEQLHRLSIIHPGR